MLCKRKAAYIRDARLSRSLSLSDLPSPITECVVDSDPSMEGNDLYPTSGPPEDNSDKEVMDLCEMEVKELAKSRKMGFIPTITSKCLYAPSNIQGLPVNYLVDTGAAYTLLSEAQSSSIHAD